MKRLAYGFHDPATSCTIHFFLTFFIFRGRGGIKERECNLVLSRRHLVRVLVDEEQVPAKIFIKLDGLPVKSRLAYPAGLVIYFAHVQQYSCHYNMVMIIRHGTTTTVLFLTCRNEIVAFELSRKIAYKRVEHSLFRYRIHKSRVLSLLEPRNLDFRWSSFTSFTR